MKRTLTLLASLALVASGLHVLPAAATEDAPALPPEPNIVDAAGDANFGTGAPGSFTGADILAGWFTHDETTISAHVQTATDARLDSVLIDVGFDPGVGAACMFIDAVTAGEANDARVELFYEGDCGDQGAVPVEGGTFTMTEGPDGTIINTITVPRSADPAFADGKTLATPFVTIWNNTADSGARGIYDDTEPGTSYPVVGGAPGKPVKPVKPAKPTKPTKPTTPVKKGCDNGKGKKKGCPPKPKSCTPVAPAAAGKDAPALTLTDAATAEKPAVQTLTLEQRFDEGIPAAVGAPGSSEAAPSSVNVTVDTDSKAPIGLYATLEFPARRDYDLWAYWPGSENKEAASSHGFSPLIETQGQPGQADQSNTASNNGGETKADSENLVGILTPDCGGYTITAYNYLGEGGDLDLKLWLGEVKYDPAETPSEDAAASMRASYDTVMSLF